jgi:O-antigen/teichoic acid export membrane protein
MTLATLTPSLAALILGLGFTSAVVYFTGTGRIGTARVSRNALGLGVAATLAGAALFLLLVATGWWDRLVPALPAAEAALSMLAFPPLLFTGLLASVVQGRQQTTRAAVVQLIQGMAWLVFTTAASLAVLAVPQWAPSSLRLAILAYVTATVVGLVAAAWMARRAGGSLRPAWERDALRPMASYGLRGYPGNLLAFFNYRLDTYLVSFFLGAAPLGIYSVSVALAELLWQLPNAVGFAIFPRATVRTTEEMNAFTPRVFAATVALTAAGAIMLALVGPLLIDLVYGAAFREAYLPLLVLLPGVVLMGGAKVLTNEIAGRGYPGYNSAATAIGLAITVILNLALIPRLGIAGAALASSIAYAAIFLAAIAYYRRVARWQPASQDPAAEEVA